MDMDPPMHFQKQKHISYWVRCLRSPLPHQYTSNDANRMSLIFFILSALDVLGALSQRTTVAERADYADWIYGCQHPDGGFRAFPGTDFGDRREATNAAWDPAHVPATYFALASLAILGDDFARVNRNRCLRWLTQMQRPSGSFGETLSENRSIEGGFDTRFGYCAMGVRWMLRGNVQGDIGGVPDTNIDGLMECIRRCEEPFDEAHGRCITLPIARAVLLTEVAGLTYCAIGASSFANRLPQALPGRGNSAEGAERGSLMGISSTAATVKWLLGRLTTDIDEDESDNEDDFNGEQHDTEGNDTGAQRSFERLGSRRMSDPVDSLARQGDELPGTEPSSMQWAGFNGRCNKLADTCYVYWAVASLDILKSLHLVPKRLVCKYLIEKVQHRVMGGFGKMPGALPDVYHAYLGLAALSLLRDDTEDASGAETGTEFGLEQVDAALCFSVRARKWLESLPLRGSDE